VSHPLARSKVQRLSHGPSICVTYVSHPLARYVDGRKFVDEICVTYVGHIVCLIRWRDQKLRDSVMDSLYV